MLVKSTLRRAASTSRLLRNGLVQNASASTRGAANQMVSVTSRGLQTYFRVFGLPKRRAKINCFTHCRTLMSTATRTNASGRTTVKDPEPQTGLYYHPTQISIYRGPNEPSSTADGWAISFLANPSSSEDAVIAYVLPTNTSSSQDSKPADFVRANPDRIHINPAGWKIMHDVLKNQVVPNDDLLNFEASTRESGWAHLTDLRHPLMPGRIATPENIIASVAFTEGKLNVESYEENKSYRLVTGYEGPIQMADGWLEKLRKRFGSL
ncbi:uncharacterized protein MEPE_01860 [Melanopsichium pennsylvanicum]|uniref:Uncharacterized protein n=1 Tax=Melanopsichium pennsylvanicum TaxID=63383 RepID=A0AAJ4XID2_9BASI|nr:uncharacterized protein MEPE_01860 [Melanopsichium pennsylvanicum]